MDRVVACPKCGTHFERAGDVVVQPDVCPACCEIIPAGPSARKRGLNLLKRTAQRLRLFPSAPAAATVAGPVLPKMLLEQKGAPPPSPRIAGHGEKPTFADCCRKAVVFLASFAALAIPVCVLQYAGSQNEACQPWLFLVGFLLTVVVGVALMVASFMYGFGQFLLVFCLPGVGLAVAIANPLYGSMVLVLTFLYTVYFVFLRMKSVAFKGVFLAYLLTSAVTGPWFAGGQPLSGQMQRNLTDINFRMLPFGGAHQKP